MTTAPTWLDELERQLHRQVEDATREPETWDTPGELAVALEPRTVQTRALQLIDQFLVDITNTPDGRGIVVMPPQEGKSQRVTRRFPTAVLKKDPDARIAIVSYEDRVARRWGRVIRDDIREHGDRLGGIRVRRDLAAQAEWQLAGYDGGVFAVGVGGGLTGRPVDLLIIDDPIKDRKQADSLVYRDMVWDWWLDVGATRLSPGAPVVLILTRWHDDDLAGRLLKAEDGHLWKMLRVPAQADHDPAKGETDPLGRQPGEYLQSARGRTTEQWDAIRVRSGSRTWNALYQGRPSAAEGDIFKRTWWKYYDTPQWVQNDDGTRYVFGFDDLILSWDLTFKDTAGTDFVVGQVWGRRGADAYLLDQRRARMDFPATQQALRELAARWPQAVLKIVEDKANGPAVIASLRRIVPGIVAEEPQGSKVARASAVSPLVEAGNVWLPAPELLAVEGESAPFAWVADFVEEAAGFPNGSHDDQVDAMTQALNRLVLQPFLDASLIVGAADIDPMLAEFQISPY